MDRRKFLGGSLGGILAFLGLGTGVCSACEAPEPQTIKVINGNADSCCPKCKHTGEHEIWIDWLNSVADADDPNRCVFNWREYRICPQCNYKYGVFTALIDFGDFAQKQFRDNDHIRFAVIGSWADGRQGQTQD